MASTAKALNTPELLEAILVRLPIRNLLITQRVAMSWRDTILRSKSIQRKMFLDFATSERFIFCDKVAKQDLTNASTAAFKQIEIWFNLAGLGACWDYMWTAGLETPTYATVYKNPVLDALMEFIRRDADTFFATTAAPHTLAWLRPEASWRQMLICSAPLTSLLEISIENASWSKNLELVQDMVDTEQWRLGDVVDELQRQWQMLPHHGSGKVVDVQYTITGSQLWEDEGMD